MMIDLPPAAQQSVADLLADLAETERAEDRLASAALLDDLASQVEKAIRRRGQVRDAVRRHRARRHGDPVPLQRRGRKPLITELDGLADAG